VFRSRKLKLAGHVAHVRQKRNYVWFWLGNLKDGDHLEGLDIDGRVIIEMDLKEGGSGH
jgi:hypothetical protein